MRGCRLTEFKRWPRLVLERERAYLSAVMCQMVAYVPTEEKMLIMHDLTDLDAALAEQPLESNPSPLGHEDS